MEQIATAFNEAWENTVAMTPRLVVGVAFVLVFLLVAHLIGRAIERGVRGDKLATRNSRLLSRLIRLGLGVFGFGIGLQILGLTAVATSLLATGGLVAVALGFAFREIGENFLAGLFLGFSRSFEVGDLIESAGHVGEVRSIELRQVWLRAADGRDIFIPSAEIFRNVLINYTRDDLRRGDFVIGLDYADDIPAARTLLFETVQAIPGVLEDPKPAARVSQFAPQYCELRVFFWVRLDGGRGLAEVRTDAMEACLKRIRERGFTLSSDISTAVTVTNA